MPTQPTTPFSPSQLEPGFKVYFMANSDPIDALQSCYNPDSLDLTVSCDIGRLGPVGWSHATQQYAKTDPIDFPMHLEFSAIRMRDKNSGSLFKDDTTGPIRWFMSHCYGEQPGKSPDPIIVIWPKTLTLLCIIRSMNVGMKRWDHRGVLTNYAIDLELSELRSEFRSSEMAYKEGFTSSSYLRGNKSGAPTRVGRAAGKWK